MINSLYIKNFKLIDEYRFELGSLNLFVGPNSSGKSSAIQALLLVCDNARKDSVAHKMVCKHMQMPSFNSSLIFPVPKRPWQ